MHGRAAASSEEALLVRLDGALRQKLTALSERALPMAIDVPKTVEHATHDSLFRMYEEIREQGPPPLTTGLPRDLAPRGIVEVAEVLPALQHLSMPSEPRVAARHLGKRLLATPQKTPVRAREPDTQEATVRCAPKRQLPRSKVPHPERYVANRRCHALPSEHALWSRDFSPAASTDAGY